MTLVCLQPPHALTQFIGIAAPREPWDVGLLLDEPCTGAESVQDLGEDTVVTLSVLDDQLCEIPHDFVGRIGKVAIFREDGALVLEVSLELAYQRGVELADSGARRGWAAGVSTLVMVRSRRRSKQGTFAHTLASK